MDAEALQAKAAAANAAPNATEEEVQALLSGEGQAGHSDDQDLDNQDLGQAGEEGGEGEAGPEGEEGSGEEEGAGDDPDLEGLNDSSKSKIQNRFDKLTKEAKEAKEEAAAIKAKLEEAEAAADRPSEAVLDIAPEYLTKGEAEQITEFQQLQVAENWLLDNLDGYEGSGAPNDPSYDAKEVRRRYQQVQTRLGEIRQGAEKMIAEKRKTMREDLAAGRALRKEKERLAAGSKGGKKPPAGAITSRSKTTPKKPALAPTGRKGFDVQTFMENGPSKEGLQAMYEGIL